MVTQNLVVPHGRKEQEVCHSWLLHLDGMLWTAKLCFIHVITDLDNKSLRVFISNQLGAGVDKYQLLQSISVK